MSARSWLAGVLGRAAKPVAAESAAVPVARRLAAACRGLGLTPDVRAVRDGGAVVALHGYAGRAVDLVVAPDGGVGVTAEWSPGETEEPAAAALRRERLPELAAWLNGGAAPRGARR